MPSERTLENSIKGEKMLNNFPPTLLCDFYKISHRAQYPEGTETVYSTWIARSSRIKGVDRVVAFGFQGFIQRYLVEYFQREFFDRDLSEVVSEYKRVIRNSLGVPDPDASHLEALWHLGYLPIEIKAIPEGMLVPLRVPMVTIVNTNPKFFWLTNYLETLFSTESWMPSTSATMALAYRRLFERYAKVTGATRESVMFQGHDFSMRGMSSVESAAGSGAGHLLSFTGTDTIPAIIYLERYYGANSDNELVGASIPATEHSVMCAYGNENGAEFNSFKRIISEVYPNGFVSVVSDTWDLWQVIGEYLPRLREQILSRDGRLVIRPDSGDPVLIMAGDENESGLAQKGVVEALWDIFGGTINEQGYRVLDPHIGAIYGDSITLERAEAILSRLAQKGFASSNVVFGIGSFTYQFTTRDTFSFALKSTSVTINGVEKMIYKDPVTDKDHTKRSLRGRVVVVKDSEQLRVIDSLTEDAAREYDDQLRVVFRNGKVYNFDKLSTIRERISHQVGA